MFWTGVLQAGGGTDVHPFPYLYILTLYLILVGGPILGLNVLEVWPYKFIHLFELIIKISIQLKSHLNISILYCWGVYFYFYKIAKNDIICFNIYEIRWNKNLVNLKICHLVYHLNYLFNQDVSGKKSYLTKEKKVNLKLS